MKAELRMAWDGVRPGEAAKKRMLEAILAAPEHPEGRQEREPLVWKTALPAAAFVAVLAGTVALSAPNGVWEPVQPKPTMAASHLPETAPELESSGGTKTFSLGGPAYAADSALVLERSKGVTADYVQAMPEATSGQNSAACWAGWTEEELAEYYREPGRDVFRGTVQSVNLLQIDYTGEGLTVYRKVAQVRVDSVLKGALEPGGTVRILLPAVGSQRWGEELMAHSTSISIRIERLEAGEQGIFALPPLTEENREEQGGDVLDYRDLADFELTDDRGTFLYRDGFLWYMDYELTPFQDWERSGTKTATLDDAEAWLNTILSQEGA